MAEYRTSKANRVLSGQAPVWRKLLRLWSDEDIVEPLRKSVRHCLDKKLRGESRPEQRQYEDYWCFILTSLGQISLQLIEGAQLIAPRPAQIMEKKCVL